MSIEENKAIIRRWIEEAFNTGDERVMDELLAPDFVSYTSGSSEVGDREDQKRAIAQLHTAFPDLTTTIEDMIAEDDKVAYRWTLRGTHRGAWGNLAATGKQITGTGITINRIVDGKIVEDRFETGAPDIEQMLVHGTTPEHVAV